MGKEEPDSDAMDKEELDSDVMFFDPDDPTLVKHTKYGVWDVYEEILRPKGFRLFWGLPLWNKLSNIIQAGPSVIRTMKDVASTPGSFPNLVAFSVLRFIASFLPALSLWYDSQLLAMVEKAVETRTLDQNALLRIAAGRVAAPIASEIIEVFASYLTFRIYEDVDRFYTRKFVQMASRLDVPTYDSMESQLEDVEENGVYDTIWELFETTIKSFSTVMSVFSQLGVLITVFRCHPEATFLLLTACARFVARALGAIPGRSLGKVTAWKSNDEDYLCRNGLEQMVGDQRSRKDIVAGGLGEFIRQHYMMRDLAIGNKPTNIYHYVQPSNWMSVIAGYIKHPVDALAHIYTCFRAVNSPVLASFSLATLQLVTMALGTLGSEVDNLKEEVTKIEYNAGIVRDFYQLLDTPNQIKDGSSPFPENQLDLSRGISVEFKNVSFAYPEDEGLVLKNISFKIEQGQLCVVVGENGSGKSTILSLISRVYDVTDGVVLINGLDIRTLKLEDVRRAIAILFQDYAIFPLTLAENIGYGDPDYAEDMHMVRQAANLGGAQDFIEALPHKFDTYVECPVRGGTSHSCSKDSIFWGKTTDFSKVGINDHERELSGGQKQRVALSRTFMKAFVRPDGPVGLLLFDEPSASLDPKAEHSLFARLRELRGQKTMIFSTHRFGKLTRYADIIIYIRDGEILEAGSHAELMRAEGEYAEFWDLQAQDFL